MSLFSIGQKKPNINTRWVAVDLMDVRATQMSIKLMETSAWQKNTFCGFFLLTRLWPNTFLFVSEWEETCQQIMHRTCRACRYASSLLLSVHPCESSWKTFVFSTAGAGVHGCELMWFSERRMSLELVQLVLPPHLVHRSIPITISTIALHFRCGSWMAAMEGVSSWLVSSELPRRPPEPRRSLRKDWRMRDGPLASAEREKTKDIWIQDFYMFISC